MLEDFASFPALAAGLTIILCLVFYKQNNTLREKYKKLYSQKKQSEVRLGQIAEQIAPFLDHFPYNPKVAQFLGNPIDYVVFEEEEVVFVEVKSGNSRLTKKQRLIKENIENGRVKFKEIRIK